MTDMDMPLPEPVNDAMPPLPEKSYLGDDVSYGYEPWDMHAYAREHAAAEVAKERERAWYWCDFYAHAIDHGGNRYVRSNDTLTAAHAVKSGTPAAAIRAGSAAP